jgi:LysM repeat protein
VTYDCPGVAGAPCNCGYQLTPVSYGSGANYTVQKGDTLYSIARRHGTTVNAIMAANGMTNPDHIRSGQTLRMPGTR